MNEQCGEHRGLGDHERERAAIDVVANLFDVSPEQRASRLAELFAHDESMRQKVSAMLRQLTDIVEDNARPIDQTKDITFVASTSAGAHVSWQPIAASTQIGSYRINRLLGSGGMGMVYEAEQDRPRRKVALKLLSAGRMSPAMLRRFEYEAEWLGRLDHPGIARVYEAGTSDASGTAQPFFAMELVDGQRLDRWIKEQSPDLRRRVQLLIDICDAVHHAHQKGIIHRDLKPANILVTAHGQPKILDFGVARAVDDQPRTLATSEGSLVGTLQYMSPEQAAGDLRQLDTRSDVYSLGVIAYEILGGRLPYEIGEQPLSKALELIERLDPPKLGTIDPTLRGDLETIVAKSIEKRKEDRYASAAELSGDLQRYLRDEPISARPPRLQYQLRKFARRRKGLVVAASMVIVAVVAGLVGTTWGLLRARQERTEAVRQKNEAETAIASAEAVTDFLTDDVIRSANPAIARGKELSVREALENAAKDVAKKFPGKPLVEASVRMALADTFASLGREALAVTHARAALEIRQRELGDEHSLTFVAMNNLAAFLRECGNYADAEPLFRRSLEGRRRISGDDHEDTLRSMNNLALLLLSRGELSEAEQLCRDAYEGCRRRFGDDHEETLTKLANLAAVLQDQDKTQEAADLRRRVVDGQRRVLGQDHPETLISIDNLGCLLQTQGRLSEAEPLLREALTGRQRVLGEDHPDVFYSQDHLAGILASQNRLDEAETLYRQMLVGFRRVLGNQDSNTAIAMTKLGILLERRGKTAEAESLYREAMEPARANVQGDDFESLRHIYRLGILFESYGKVVQAEALFAEVYRRAPSTQTDPKRTAVAMSYYGVLLAKLGRHREASAPLRDAHARLLSAGLDNHERTRLVTRALVDVCKATGRTEEESEWRAKLSAFRESTSPSSLPMTRPSTVPATAAIQK